MRYRSPRDSVWTRIWNSRGLDFFPIRLMDGLDVVFIRGFNKKVFERKGLHLDCRMAEPLWIAAEHVKLRLITFKVAAYLGHTECPRLSSEEAAESIISTSARILLWHGHLVAVLYIPQQPQISRRPRLFHPIRYRFVAFASSASLHRFSASPIAHRNSHPSLLYITLKLTPKVHGVL